MMAPRRMAACSATRRVIPLGLVQKVLVHIQVARGPLTECLDADRLFGRLHHRFPC